MTKKKSEAITPEVRELINEAARATASVAYADNGGGINYFRAMESLLYNYKKLAALVADEEAYTVVEYHAKSKSIVGRPSGSPITAPVTSEDAIDELRRQKVISYQRTKAHFDEVDRIVRLFSNRKEFIVIRLYYFNEDAAGNERADDQRYTFEDIAFELDELGLAKDEKTARRWRSKIVNDMAVCMFGKAAAIGVGV